MRRPPGVVVSITSVNDCRSVPLFSSWFTVAIRCVVDARGDQASRKRVRSPSHTAKACAKPGQSALAPAARPRKSECTLRREGHRAGEPCPAPTLKPVHNRSRPSRFSRTRPSCRPTIIASGLPFSSAVPDKVVIGRETTDCRTCKWRMRWRDGVC